MLGFGACVITELTRFAALEPPVGLSLADAPALGAPAETARPRLRLNSTTLIPAPAEAPSAHASAIAAGPNGDLLAFWWAGTRESAPDVAIYSARWADGQWSPARRILTREALAGQLGFGVRRLGNPTVWIAPDGKIHLYVVATGLGGWAASRVVQLVSADRGERFSATRVLPLTPLLNTSVLVRTRPVGLGDGGWLLPAYFELGNKFPLLVAFDSQGVPQWTRRIGHSTTSLQPALLPLSPTELRALMRDHGQSRRVQQAFSSDSGKTWHDEAATDLINHDSSVAALRLSEGGFVLVHNDQLPAPANPRQWLRLSTSSDGVRWSADQGVRVGLQGEEHSYPAVLQVGRQLHVTYTSQRREIGHCVFDILPRGSTP
jgi:predicted neuraminidase